MGYEEKTWEFISQAIAWEIENSGQYTREGVIIKATDGGYVVTQEEVGETFKPTFKEAFELFRRLVIAGRM